MSKKNNKKDFLLKMGREGHEATGVVDKRASELNAEYLAKAEQTDQTHSRYWSIKWYGGRGRFDINQGLAAASTVPPVVFSLPW